MEDMAWFLMECRERITARHMVIVRPTHLAIYIGGGRWGEIPTKLLLKAGVDGALHVADDWRRKHQPPVPAGALRDVAEALNRYGRHEKGCGLLRTPSRMAECSCGLHAAIRAGGVKP